MSHGEETINVNERQIEKNNSTTVRTQSPPVVNNGKPVDMGPSKVTIGVLFGLAALLLVGGVIVGVSWISIFNSIVSKELVLTPTSTSYGMWKETPIPMYLNLYLYNWTNTEEFSNSSGTKPNFVQTGPYVFKEIHEKVNQTWNDNGTVTFRQQKFWHFQESMSNGSLDDEITNLNVIAVTVGHMAKNQGTAYKLIVNSFLKLMNETLFVTKTARELLFDGYDDAFLHFVKNLNISVLNIPFDKFGWFYGRNGSETYDGIFNMHTGVDNISDLGVLDKWNYSNETNHWSGECNAIKGTTGELWPPVNRDETVEIFAPDICTSLTLYRNNDSNFLGLNGYTYVTEEATFDNGSLVPSRACYCPDEACHPSGVLDVSGCRFGAPAYISLPHFYKADDSYVNAVDGMEPREDEYNFKITLEPNTGIPLNVQAKLQINIKVEPVKRISILEDVPDILIPMLWFSQTAELTENYASGIRMLLKLPTVGHIIFISIACVGVLLALVACFLLYRRSRSGEDNESLIQPNDLTNNGRSEPIIS